MKTSELIEKLQEAKNDCGDIDIQISVDVEGNALKDIDQVAHDNVGNVLIIWPREVS